MKKLLIFLTLFSTTLYAQITQNECALNFDGVKSPLNPKSKMFKSIESEKRDPESKTVSQNAVLASGESLTFQAGGCAHLGHSFIYKNYKLKDKRPETIFKEAISLLKKTETINSYEKKVLIEALDRAHKSGLKAFAPNSYPLQCPNSECMVELFEIGKKEEMRISHSFML